MESDLYYEQFYTWKIVLYLFDMTLKKNVFCSSWVNELKTRVYLESFGNFPTPLDVKFLELGDVRELLPFKGDG